MRGKEFGKRICLFMAAAVLLGFSAGGCMIPKEDEEPKRYTIGVVTKSRDSEYWMSVCSGMEKAARDFGVSVLIVYPDSETDYRMQEKMVHDLLQEGVDALAVSPVRSQEADYLTEAGEKNILVVAYDTKILEEGIPYIGIDNEKAGEELAKAMAERIGDHGKVGIVTGDLNQSAHAERLLGIRTYLFI